MTSYAVVTKPEFRNKSYGKTLVTYIKENVISQGNLSLVCPAKPSLIKFYESLGYKPIFHAKEIIFNKTNNSNISHKLISAQKYLQNREAFLRIIPHAKINKSLLSFVQDKNGDNQKLISIDNDSAICILDCSKKNYLYVPELLINENNQEIFNKKLVNILNSLCTYYGKDKIKVRYIDAMTDNKNLYVQGMLAGSNNFKDEMAYYGFPMD